MELASYADRAVALVNTADPYRHRDSLTTVQDVKDLLAAYGTQRCRVVLSDLDDLRALRETLRAVFDGVDRDRVEDAVALMNGLLERYPVRPQIAAHDGASWHLHLAEGASASAAFAAKACMGLAVQATEVGMDRLGVCQAAPCREVFIDTSTNRSRRYCSDRCATRANVAAYRARRKAASQLAAVAH